MANSTNRFQLLDSVISQAQSWGFICQRQESNNWQIFPQQANSKWKLEQERDSWISHSRRRSPTSFSFSRNDCFFRKSSVKKLNINVLVIIREFGGEKKRLKIPTESRGVAE